MGKDYIDREYLLSNRPEYLNPTQERKEEYNRGWNDCCSEFCKIITNQPTISLDYKSFEEVPNSWLDRCSDNGYARYTDNNGNRRYEDNNIKTEDMPFRPCKKCGQYPNKNGDDYCIQNLGKVVNACCGHGTHKGYIMFDDGTIIRGYFTVERPENEVIL